MGDAAEFNAKSRSGGSREFIVNDIPIAHFDFPDQDPGDAKAAARWAWAFLENLARGLCCIHCDLTYCSIGAREHGYTLGRPGDANLEDLRRKSYDRAWLKIQEDFHEALSYFPQSRQVAEGCPACSVAIAFSYFPRLALDSPVPPVAEVRMNAVDCYPDVVFAGGTQLKSIPCYIISTDCGDFCTEREEVIRERALLKFDPDDLPIMHPGRAVEVKAALMNGQAVVREIDKAINPEEYHEIQPANPAGLAAAETKDENQPEQRTDSGAIEREKRPVTISRDGELWVLIFENKSIRMKDMKGLHYIAYLIDHPGRNCPSVQLLTAFAGAKDEMEFGSSAEMLDEKAINCYKRRLDDLEEEIMIAATNADLTGQERLESERDALVQQLKGALGLDGRRRRYFDAADRARKSISNAINRALRKIERQHANLGQHLRSAIKQGHLFVYTPK